MDNQNQEYKASKKEKFIGWFVLILALGMAVAIIAVMIDSERDRKEMVEDAFWSSFEIKIPTEEPDENKQAVTEKETVHHHGFGEWIIDQEATCTAPGQQKRSCLCGEFEVQEIPAGHEWQEATCTEAEKCTLCEETQGMALGHDMKNTVCTRCGKRTEVLIHEDANVKITFHKAGISYDDAKVYFYVENKTNENLILYADVISLDGISFDHLVMADVVAAGSAGSVDVHIMEFDASQVDIDNIKKIGGKLVIKSDDDDGSVERYEVSFANIAIE